MRAILQRAKKASVTINDEVVGAIDKGFVVLFGVTHEDTQADIDYLVNKIIHLRVFNDENNKMNLSLSDISGEILSISQFTLYAETKKGRRPSFTAAGHPDMAKELYNAFNESLRQTGIHVETGEFGADMDVRFTNDGPVTIMIDSKDR